MTALLPDLPVWTWALFAALFAVLLVALLRLCRRSHDDALCWSHSALGDEEDARVRSIPPAEPLKAALMARQSSTYGHSDTSRGMQPADGDRDGHIAARVFHPVARLFRPVLPASLLPERDDDRVQRLAAGDYLSSPHSGAMGTLTPSPLTPDPLNDSPYSPTHTHPYAVATYQNPTWGSSAAAAILRPADDLYTPQQNSRTLARDINAQRV